MNTGTRKLHRLARLERLRAIAKHTALDEAASAERHLAEATALAARTTTLAKDYGARRDAEDAGALRRLATFAGGLHALQNRAEADVTEARAAANQRQSALATAERRRALVAERLEDLARRLAARRTIAHAEAAALAGRRPAHGDAAAIDPSRPQTRT